VSDLCGEKIPDERSGKQSNALTVGQGTKLIKLLAVITYVAEFFHAFSSLDKAEVTTRRVEKFATMLNGIQSVIWRKCEGFLLKRVYQEAAARLYRPGNACEFTKSTASF
jgi:hypothetical protein